MRRRAKELFTASDVAKFCQVDLKTIHNWADRGTLTHFRTPGRHLRFRRLDLLDFLRRYGYPIPSILLDGDPKVLLVGDCDPVRSSLQGFDVRHQSQSAKGLIEVGRNAPDVVILDGDQSDVMPDGFINAVVGCDGLKHVRVVLWANEHQPRDTWLSRGASAVVAKPNVSDLREAVEALTGRNR